MSGHNSIDHAGCPLVYSRNHLIHAIYTKRQISKFFVEVEVAPNEWAESQTRMHSKIIELLYQQNRR